MTVEVNGLQHYEQLLREADDFQRAVLQISGRIVVDLSSYAVRHQREQSMLLVAETLTAHGWQPSPRAVRVLGGLPEPARLGPGHPQGVLTSTAQSGPAAVMRRSAANRSTSAEGRLTSAARAPARGR